MAFIQKRTNGRWAVRWRDLEARQRWKTFQTRQEAVDHRKRVEFELVEGTAAPQPNRTVTFSKFYDGWQPQQVWRPSTVDKVRSQFRCHVTPVFGGRRLISIGHAELQSWIQRLTTQLSPGSIQTLATDIRVLFDTAVRLKIIPDSPATGLRLPRLTRPVTVPPTEAQVRTLRDGLPARFQRIVTVASATGMRQGELLELTVGQVDRDREMIIVDRQMTQTSQGLVFGPPKTPSRARVIPVPAELIKVVDEQIQLCGPGDDGLLFTTDSARPIRRNRFSATCAVEGDQSAGPGVRAGRGGLV